MLFRLQQFMQRSKRDEKPSNIYSSLLKQFDLEAPNFGRNRRKSPWFAHTTLLSLSILLGLTMGIGSAFASKEMVPSAANPVDQPPSQTAPLPSSQSKDTFKAPSVESQAPLQSSTEEIPMQKETAPVEPITGSSTPLATPAEEKSAEVPPLDEKSSTDGSRVEPAIQQEKEPSTKEASPDLLTPPVVESSKSSHPALPSSTLSSGMHRTIRGGSLPITATSHLNYVLMGLAIAGIGYYLLRKNGKTT